MPRARAACGRRSSRRTTTSSPRATARPGASPPSSRIRMRSSRRTGRSSRSRGSSRRSPTRWSRPSSPSSSAPSPTLSPVEGRLAHADDVAVVDIVSEEGPGQRDYVVEVGTERLLPRARGRDQAPAARRHRRRGLRVARRVAPEHLGHAEGALRARSAAARRLARDLRVGVRHLRRAAGPTSSRTIEAQLEQEADARFRIDAVDELLKASKVEVAGLVVDVRTRDLLNAFIRQLETRGIDPVAYLRAAGVSGADLEQRFREEAANSIGRELVLEGVADKLGIEVSDDDIRSRAARGRRERKGRGRVHRGRRAPTACATTSASRKQSIGSPPR